MLRENRQQPEPAYGSYERWYEHTDQLSEPFQDRTWGESVWKAARKSLLAEQRKRRQKTGRST